MVTTGLSICFSSRGPEGLEERRHGVCRLSQSPVAAWEGSPGHTHRPQPGVSSDSVTASPSKRPAPMSRHGSDRRPLTAPPEQRLQTQLPGLSPATHRSVSEQSCCWGLNPLGCATACPLPPASQGAEGARTGKEGLWPRGASLGQSRARHTTVRRTTYASHTIFTDCPKQCPLTAVRDCPGPDDTSRVPCFCSEAVSH